MKVLNLKQVPKSSKVLLSSNFIEKNKSLIVSV